MKTVRAPGYVQGILWAGALAALALWLRWPTFGFSLWNVDEAIHAAAARTILDGGVLYRDAIDQRTPLTYYAVAGVFRVFGENNLWAVRCGIALLVGATGWLLLVAGHRLRNRAAGICGGFLYVLLATSALYPGDANAANTEWFVAFFSSAAAAVFLGGGPAARNRRYLTTGLLASGAFLSKQPALLDAAAPFLTVLYVGWRQGRPRRETIGRLAAFAAGWLLPVAAAAAYFLLHGAGRDALFYTWTYNLRYYGAAVTFSDRVMSLVEPLHLVGAAGPALLALWLAGAAGTLHRLLQRHPQPAEAPGNPGRLFVTVWSVAALAGAGSGGRDFQHYSIQFLAPFCLGAGLALGWLYDRAAAAPGHWLARLAAGAVLAGLIFELVPPAVAGRKRRQGEDPARTVAAYIRQHGGPDDRIFVWGYHPDLYLYSDRRPASRFLYASFLTGLLPWINADPDVPTDRWIVPGAMDQLLADLRRRQPRYIVDCSPGYNRYWHKYPLADFAPLAAYVRDRYRVVEPQVFVPTGFQLYELKSAPAGDRIEPAMPPLPASTLAQLAVGTLGAPLVPLRASAPNGTNVSMVDGHLEYFAHAPSSIVYRLGPAATGLRGGFGIQAGAYAPDNKGSTDGAEFVIRWRPDGAPAQVLLRRLLRPREEAIDRPLQSFHVRIPPHHGGELELEINPGPLDNNASDWTFWTDLALENNR